MNQASVCPRNRITISKGSMVAQMLALVILLTVGMTSTVATLFVVAVLCVCFMFMNASEIVASMLFFYPLYNLFKFNGNGISYYNVLIVVATICLMTKHNSCKNGRICLRIDKNIGLLFVLCVYVTMVSLMYGQVGALSSVVLDLFIPLLFVGAVVNHKDINLTSVIYAFSLGAILAGAVGSGWLPVSNLEAYVDTLGYRVAGVRIARLQGLTVNPNYYSLDVNLAITGVLALPQMQKRRIKKTEWILVVLLAIMGVMTLSKSFFLGLIATFGVMVFFSGNMKKFIALVSGIVSAVVVVSVLYAQNNSYVIAMFNRLGDGTGSMEAMTSSRSVIWIGYLKYLFLENPVSLIVGNGIGAGALEAVGKVSHSVYIESFYYLGATGVVLLLAFLVGFCRKGKRNNIQYLPLCVFLVRALAINLLLREAFMICMIIVVLYINYGFCPQQN